MPSQEGSPLCAPVSTNLPSDMGGTERTLEAPVEGPVAQRVSAKNGTAMHRKRSGGFNEIGSKRQKVLPPAKTLKSLHTETWTPQSDPGASKSSSSGKSEQGGASGIRGGTIPPAAVPQRKPESRTRNGTNGSHATVATGGRSSKKGVLLQLSGSISGAVRALAASGSSRVVEFTASARPKARPPGVEFVTLSPTTKGGSAASLQFVVTEEQRRRQPVKVKAELFRDVLNLGNLDASAVESLSALSVEGAASSVPPDASASSTMEPAKTGDCKPSDALMGPETAGSLCQRTPLRSHTDATPQWGDSDVVVCSSVSGTSPSFASAVATELVASPCAPLLGDSSPNTSSRAGRVAPGGHNSIHPVVSRACRPEAPAAITEGGDARSFCGRVELPLPATDMDGMAFGSISGGRQTDGMLVHEGSSRFISHSRNCSFSLSRINSMRTSAAKLTLEKEDALRSNRSKFLTRQHTPPPQGMLQMAKQVRRRQLRHAVIPEDEETSPTVVAEPRLSATESQPTSEPPGVVELTAVNTLSSNSISTCLVNFSHLGDINDPVCRPTDPPTTSAPPKVDSEGPPQDLLWAEPEPLHADTPFPQEPPELTATSPLVRLRPQRRLSNSFTRMGTDEDTPLVVTYSGIGRMRDVHGERERFGQVRLSASFISRGTPSIGSLSLEAHNPSVPWFSVSKLSHASVPPVLRAISSAAKSNDEAQSANIGSVAQERGGLRDSSGAADGSSLDGKRGLSDAGDVTSEIVTCTPCDTGPSLSSSAVPLHSVDPGVTAPQGPIGSVPVGSSVSAAPATNTDAVAAGGAPESTLVSTDKPPQGAAVLLAVEESVAKECLLPGARNDPKGSPKDSRAEEICTASLEPKPEADAADSPCTTPNAPEAESREAAGDKVDGSSEALPKGTSKRAGRAPRSGSWHQLSDGEVDSVRSSWSLSWRRIASAERRRQHQKGPRRIHSLHSDPEDPSSMDDGSLSESGGATERQGRADRRSPIVNAPRKACGAPELGLQPAGDDAQPAEEISSATAEEAKAVAQDADGSRPTSASMKLTGYYGFDVLESLSAGSDISSSMLPKDLLQPTDARPLLSGDDEKADSAEGGTAAVPQGATESSDAVDRSPLLSPEMCSTDSPTRTRQVRGGASHPLPPVLSLQLDPLAQANPAVLLEDRDWVSASVMHSRESVRSDAGSERSVGAPYYSWDFGMHYGYMYNDDYDDDGADVEIELDRTLPPQREAMPPTFSTGGSDSALEEVGGEKEVAAGEHGTQGGAEGSSAPHPDHEALDSTSDVATAPASGDDEEEDAAETKPVDETWSNDDAYEPEEEELLSDSDDVEYRLLEGFRPPEFNRPRSAREPCGILFVLTMEDSIMSTDEIWNPKRGQFMQYKLVDNNTVRQMESGEHALHPRVMLRTTQHDGPTVHNVDLLAMGYEACPPARRGDDATADQSATAPEDQPGTSPGVETGLPIAPLLPHIAARKMTSLLLPTKFKGDANKVICPMPNTFGEDSMDGGSEGSSDADSYSSDDAGRGGGIGDMNGRSDKGGRGRGTMCEEDVDRHGNVCFKPQRVKRTPLAPVAASARTVDGSP